jgi:hypothetical protein
MNFRWETPFNLSWKFSFTASFCIILHLRTVREKTAWGSKPYRLERLNKKEKTTRDLQTLLVIYASASSTKTS